ncbi:pilus assembly protein TadG-related protein [Candidatus Protofrankia californiensis]|uniref:pilus assembly protein TadG-related protein n=1 Tax=Candidatus Protofrankia californiensis TaxID=1839754 RepID=UPI0010411639|nr:pilus assembly protein TadG-related protein [Candidatus Protofrankia californiensis]
MICQPRGDSDRGSVSLFLAVIFTAAVIFAGLVYDAGRVLDANSHAFDLAGKAARAGAQDLDLTGLRTGVVRVDPDAARRTALAYLARHGVTGQVAVADTRVTVTVALHIDYRLLTLIGRTGATVTGTRTAVATAGP